MTDKELNSIGQWLNTKGYDLDLTDCFWMEDWIANETKFRDIAELLQEYHKEQLLIGVVTKRWLFWFESEGKDGYTFEIEAEDSNDAYDKAYDSYGPQVAGMMYQVI